MSGSPDAMRAIMDRLIEITKRKAEAKGKSILKPPPKPRKGRRCREEKLN